MAKKAQTWMMSGEASGEQVNEEDRVWGLVPEAPVALAEREPSSTTRGDESTGTVEWLCRDCKEWKQRDTCFYKNMIKENKKQCKQCQMKYTVARRKKREQADFCLRIAKNIRRRERLRGFATHIKETDVRAILEKFNFACVITKKNIRTGCRSTLLPVHLNKGLSPTNAVPICVGPRILTRILNGDYPDWQEIASGSSSTPKP